MRKDEFKAGDLVYYPSVSTQVFLLEYYRDSGCGTYPLCIKFDKDVSEPFTEEGLRYPTNVMPKLFHATLENQALLEQLYGMKFEPAPVEPTSKEIIKKMLGRGDKAVPCWVSDVNENPSADYAWAYIVQVVEGREPFVGKNGSQWRYATPFDPKTEQPITELPT